jgi:hypothetical protein
LFGRAVAVGAVVVMGAACAPQGAYPSVPRGRDAWGIFDAEGQNDWVVLDFDAAAPMRSFTVGARALECNTEKGGRPFRGRSAVLAQCDAGTIVMASTGYHRVRLACLKPTTREKCEWLLDQISLAGESAVADRR